MRNLKCNLAILFLILTSPLTPALADEMEIWYGRITIEQTLHKTKTETYQPGDAYYPGQRNVTDHQTWTGTIEYLPDERIVTNSTYITSFSDIRRTQKTRNCPKKGVTGEYRDFETTERSMTISGSVENKGHLSIYIGDDGQYRINGSILLPPKPDALSSSHVREFYDGCNRNPLKRTATSGKSQGIFMPYTAMAIANSGTLPPEKLEGETESMLPKQEGITTKISWSLTRAVPKIVPRISAPSTFTRGDLVTLDASSSLGDITEYDWRFAYGENCAPAIPADPELVLRGPKLTFKALCDFRAYLTLKDSMGNGDHTSSGWIRVKPRHGESWKTKFTTNKGPNLTERLMPEYMRMGVNQCAKHPTDTRTGHYIHTSVENNRTWIDDGYEVEQIGDNGPFAGMWWVARQKLEVDRVERMNQNLSAGEAYNINQAKGTLNDFKQLKPQVVAHEAMHSTLLKEALETLGDQGDPAARVEAVLGGSRDIVQTFADMQIRDVEQILTEATSDENVAKRLRVSTNAFDNSVTIWLPDTDNTLRKITLGPLWSLGE